MTSSLFRPASPAIPAPPGSSSSVSSSSHARLLSNAIVASPPSASALPLRSSTVTGTASSTVGSDDALAGVADGTPSSAEPPCQQTSVYSGELVSLAAHPTCK
ncbi:hypothetical protein OH77DRAFT_1432417, partial [Trametes cingulata]